MGVYENCNAGTLLLDSARLYMFMNDLYLHIPVPLNVKDVNLSWVLLNLLLA